MAARSPSPTLGIAVFVIVIISLYVLVSLTTLGSVEHSGSPHHVPISNNFEQVRTTTPDETTSIKPSVVVSSLPTVEGDFTVAALSDPEAASRKWFLILGIFSYDSPRQSKFRDRIRSTWLNFPNVWHPSKNPEGTILARFVMGRKSLMSDSVRQEAESNQDIWFMDSDDDGHNGKSWAFFNFLHLNFGSSELGGHGQGYVYGAKVDDDAFVRTVLVEEALQGLPDIRLYWGLGKHLTVTFVHPVTQHRLIIPDCPVIFGMTAVLSSDLVAWISQNVPEWLRDQSYEDITLGGWFKWGNFSEVRPSSSSSYITRQNHPEFNPVTDRHLNFINDERFRNLKFYARLPLSERKNALVVHLEVKEPDLLEDLWAIFPRDGRVLVDSGDWKRLDQMGIERYQMVMENYYKKLKKRKAHNKKQGQAKKKKNTPGQQPVVNA